MRNSIFLFLCIGLICSCTKKTEYGECKGVFQKEERGLEYSLSAWNAFLGILFIETIIVPVLVLRDQIKCPTDIKEGSNENRSD